MQPPLRDFMKRLIWLCLTALLLLVLGIVAISLNQNRIVRAEIVRQTSDSLNVPTTLGAADLSVLGRELRIYDYTIGSPAGYSSPHLAELSETDLLAPNFSALRGQPVHLTSVTFKSPRVFLEQAHGKFNIKALTDNQPKPRGTDEKHIRLVIDEVRVENALVVLRPNLPGMAEEIQVQVPELTLKNIGADGQGATIKDSLLQILTALAGKAAESDQLPAQLKLCLNPGAAIRNWVAGWVPKFGGSVQENGKPAANDTYGATVPPLGAVVGYEKKPK